MPPTQRLLACLSVLCAILLGAGTNTVLAIHNDDQLLVLKSASELDYPPFAVVKPDGTADGFSVELLKAVVEAAHHKVDIAVGPWHEIKQQLADGYLDVLPLVAYTPERDKVFDFTAPYLQMHGTIFVRKGNRSIRTEADLKDKEILVMRDDSSHEYAISSKIPAKLILTDTFEEAMRLLSSGKHDAVLCQYLMGLQLTKKLGITNVVSVSETRDASLKPRSVILSGFEQKFCFAVPEGRKELLAFLNEGLAIVFANGSYAEIYDKWFEPILPAPSVPLATLIKSVLIVLIPVLLILAIVGIWYLNRQVHLKTQNLRLEIQERKKIEETLIESETNYRDFVEGTDDLVTRTDSDEVLTFVNSKATKYFGLTPEKCIGRSAFDFIHPEDQKMTRDWFALCEAQKLSSSTIENRQINLKTDERFSMLWTVNFVYDSQGGLKSTKAIGRDITGRKQAEQRFQTIVQTTVGFTGQQLLDNICTQLCQAFNSECAIVGELAGPTTVKAISMLLDGKPVKNFSYQAPGTPCGNVLVNGFSHYPEDVCRLFPESRELHEIAAVGYVGAPLVDQNGTAVGILCVMSKKKLILPERAADLMSVIAARASAEIERMSVEREKQEMEGRLHQAQKMEAIGTLAGGIAHDFNNILGVILGYTDLAKEDAPPGSKIKEDLDKISKAANRAAQLVKQILAFSRQSQVERIPIKIQPLIKEALKMVRSSIPTTISIVQDIAHQSGSILADPTQIHQIIMNLSTNAYHAMESSGGVLSVSMKTTVVADDDKKMLLHVAAGEYVELIVSDTGSGIAPDVIDKIFNPYFTTKEIGRGTGMGLSITHGIMKDCGGAITVESTLGQGSTFHIYFPVVARDALPQIKEAEDIPVGKERILFVDDEELLAEMGKNMLERLGYYVTVRRSSIEALAIFQKSPNEFDVVITDQTMPDMTGSDLARRMLQIRPDMPIILCTGYSNLIDEDSAKALGIKEFALKPLTKATIARLVRNVLESV
nr:transporter substrate-binding domain-containing protein [Desulfobulbaceae bacterium]